jgi:class 3 adenylate cyclase
MAECVRSDVSLPHGRVTFLFTDIEGSRRPLQELGDEYANALAGHCRMLREEFARHGGVDWVLDGHAAEPIVRRAIEQGIRFFDTADM